MQTKKEKNKFKYSLDLLKRINCLKVGDQTLADVRILGSYNYWMFFQQRIFFNDIKDYLATTSVSTQLSYITRFKDLVLSLVALLISLSALLLVKLRGIKVGVYSVDRTNSNFSGSDARLDPIYQALEIEKEPFVEFFHTILGKEFLYRIFIRKRFAFYQSGIDFIFSCGQFLGIFNQYPQIDFSLFDLSEFALEERSLVKKIVEKYLTQKPLVEFRVKCYQKIFQILKFKLILSIDDPRDYNEVVLGAKLAGVKFYAFQHGHFSKYHVGWLSSPPLSREFVRPDRLYVWSDFWKRELLRLGTYFHEEEIFVGGLKGPLPILKGINSPVITVVIPFEIDSDKESVKRYIDEILQNDNIKIIFKLRSDMSQKEQISLSLLENVVSPQLSFIVDNHIAIKEGTVVAGTYSTYLYDMISYEKPVVYLQSPIDYGEGLLVHRLTEQASLSSISEILRSTVTLPKEVLRERKELLYGKSPALMVDAVRKAVIECSHHV